MDRRLSREPSLQKKAMENRRKAEPVPDLTDFMNDMFFGTVDNDKQTYNLTGAKKYVDDEEDFDDSTRSNSSRLTQEWLQEARRMVASSPSRSDSPARLLCSPRFAAQPGRLSMSSLDRRDPLSRSARRNRSVESFSEEILSKTAKHGRNRSETALGDTQPDSPTGISPASAVHQWFSNILKPTNPIPTPSQPTSPSRLPPRQPAFRKSRFIQVVESSPATQQQGIPVPGTGRRNFKAPSSSLQGTSVLSPPKCLVESAQRRSVSSSTCSLPENEQLSPPKKLVESAHRRSISKSTCSLEKISPRSNGSNGWFKEEEGSKELSLNWFLKEQRRKMEMIVNGEVDSKAKIVLSGPSNSTSSMAAAICYAWLMEKRPRKSNEEEFIFVPVMNLKRARMWQQRQAAWLFHHVALDASYLLFADEVDLESLMMAGQLSMLVVGQDILRTNGEVGSSCTILTDNYCEDAYDLLKSPMVKTFLLAGILLDTQNLNASAKLSMGRDIEAVQLLLVGSAPNCRTALFDQLMQDQRDNSFFEVLRHNYGKPPSERTYDNGGQMEHKTTGRKSASESTTPRSDKNSADAKTPRDNKGTPKSGKPDPQTKQTPAAAPDNSRGKNKFFLAKWFGFGSK